jgi:hypothetical protein
MTDDKEIPLAHRPGRRMSHVFKRPAKPLTKDEMQEMLTKAVANTPKKGTKT